MQDPPAPDTTPSAGAPPRCVVLHAPGRSPDAQLLGALDRQNLTSVCEGSPHRALARLCAHAEGRRMVLLFASPDAAPDLARVSRAVERYAPDAACWIHEPGANPPVRAFVEEGMPLPALNPPAAQTPRPSGGSPMLRLIDAPDGAGDAPGQELTAQRVLSKDELSLLLAEGRDDP